MPIATVYRDGKAVRTTTLTAAQGGDFVTLAEGVRLAQSVLQFNPTTPGTTHLSGVDEYHGASIYNVLPRIAELLGKHARAEYAHLDQAINGEVIRNTDGTPAYGLKLAHKNTPIPPPFHPAAALASQATTLGMLPTDGKKFEYSELTDSAPAGSGVPQQRAYVRWRA